MYTYISWVNDHSKTDQEAIHKIKEQLAASEINGKHIEAHDFKSAKQAAAAAIEQGAKTIVAIGQANCFNALIDSVAAHDQDNCAVGFIPLSSQATSTTNLLGIKGWKDGLAILAARKLHDFTLLGTKNGYILSELRLTIQQSGDKATPIECTFDDKLTLRAICHELKITNLENQSQPHPKRISIEALAPGTYEAPVQTKESFINLPHLLKGRAKDDRVLFRLLADEVKIDPKDNRFNEYELTNQTSPILHIGHDTATVRVIVKKHRDQ